MADVRNVDSLMSTSLWSDISDIANNKAGGISTPAIDIEIKIHNVDHDITKYDNVSMVGMVISRDYVGTMGDYIEAVFTIPLGLYLTNIYPYLHNTEVSLIRGEQTLTPGLPSFRVERYKAVFLKDRNANLPTHLTGSKDDANQLGVVPLVLQLINRTAEVLRVKTTYGIFDKASITKSNVPNYNISDFLTSVIAQEANKIIVDGKPCLSFVDVEKPDNKDKLSSLVVPSGTRLVEIPLYVQEDSTGIYHSGLGTYIQPYKKKTGMYVYSLYNPTKYNEAVEKIVFLVPQSGSHSIGRHTYSYKNNLLRVITDPNTNIMNLKESAEMSIGSGVRNTDANAMMKKPVEMTADGPKAVRHQLNTEIAAKERMDGVNYAPVRKGDQISSNLFKKLSIVNKSLGSVLTLVWHNADYEMIYPGAPCKIITLATTSKAVEIYGVIQKVDVTINGYSPAKAVTQNRKSTYDVTCSIDIFVLNDSLNSLGNKPS